MSVSFHKIFCYVLSFLIGFASPLQVFASQSFGLQGLLSGVSQPAERGMILSGLELALEEQGFKLPQVSAYPTIPIQHTLSIEAHLNTSAQRARFISTVWASLNHLAGLPNGNQLNFFAEAAKSIDLPEDHRQDIVNRLSQYPGLAADILDDEDYYGALQQVINSGVLQFELIVPEGMTYDDAVAFRERLVETFRIATRSTIAFEKLDKLFPIRMPAEEKTNKATPTGQAASWARRVWKHRNQYPDVAGSYLEMDSGEKARWESDPDAWLAKRKDAAEHLLDYPDQPYALELLDGRYTLDMVPYVLPGGGTVLIPEDWSVQASEQIEFAQWLDQALSTIPQNHSAPDIYEDQQGRELELPRMIVPVAHFIAADPYFSYGEVLFDYLGGNGKADGLILLHQYLPRIATQEWGQVHDKLPPLWIKRIVHEEFAHEAGESGVEFELDQYEHMRLAIDDLLRTLESENDRVIYRLRFDRLLSQMMPLTLIELKDVHLWEPLNPKVIAALRAIQKQVPNVDTFGDVIRYLEKDLLSPMVNYGYVMNMIQFLEKRGYSVFEPNSIIHLNFYQLSGDEKANLALMRELYELNIRFVDELIEEDARDRLRESGVHGSKINRVIEVAQNFWTDADGNSMTDDAEYKDPNGYKYPDEPYDYSLLFDDDDDFEGLTVHQGNENKPAEGVQTIDVLKLHEDKRTDTIFKNKLRDIEIRTVDRLVALLKKDLLADSSFFKTRSIKAIVGNLYKYHGIQVFKDDSVFYLDIYKTNTPTTSNIILWRKFFRERIFSIKDLQVENVELLLKGKGFTNRRTIELILNALERRLTERPDLRSNPPTPSSSALAGSRSGNPLHDKKKVIHRTDNLMDSELDELFDGINPLMRQGWALEVERQGIEIVFVDQKDGVQMQRIGNTLFINRAYTKRAKPDVRTTAFIHDIIYHDFDWLQQKSVLGPLSTANADLYEAYALVGAEHRDVSDWETLKLRLITSFKAMRSYDKDRISELSAPEGVQPIAELIQNKLNYGNLIELIEKGNTIRPEMVSEKTYTYLKQTNHLSFKELTQLSREELDDILKGNAYEVSHLEALLAARGLWLRPDPIDKPLGELEGLDKLRYRVLAKKGQYPILNDVYETVYVLKEDPLRIRKKSEVGSPGFINLVDVLQVEGYLTPAEVMDIKARTLKPKEIGIQKNYQFSSINQLLFALRNNPQKIKRVAGDEAFEELLSILVEQAYLNAEESQEISDQANATDENDEGSLIMDVTAQVDPSPQFTQEVPNLEWIAMMQQLEADLVELGDITDEELGETDFGMFAEQFKAAEVVLDQA